MTDAIKRAAEAQVERHGSCHCDTNPSTTDGPQQDCPAHGSPYSYWVERADRFGEQVEAVRALVNDPGYGAIGRPLATAIRAALDAEN